MHRNKPKRSPSVTGVSLFIGVFLACAVGGLGAVLIDTITRGLFDISLSPFTAGVVAVSSFLLALEIVTSVGKK